MSAPALEANICGGKYVLVIQVRTDRKPWAREYHYDDCPGCAGCDYDTVSARQAAKAPADPFARFPCDDDAEW